MDEKLTAFLVKEFKIKNILLAPLDLLLLIGATVAGILLRIELSVAEDAFYPIQEELFSHLAGKSAEFGFMQYSEYMSFLNRMGVVTGIFDLLLAIIVSTLIYNLTKHKIKAFLSYGIMVLLPVLAAGSAMWRMGDSIYLFLAVLSVYLLVKEKAGLAIVIYTVSVVLNIYAWFLFPVFLVLGLQGKLGKAKYGLIFSVLGGFIHGVLYRQAPSVFPVFKAEQFFELVRTERLLSYNWPNIYQLLGTDKYVEEYSQVAIAFALGLCIMIITLVISRTREMSKEQLLNLIVLCCLIIPFFAPFMDERAGLLADIFVLVWGFVNIKKCYLPIVQITISYMAYSAYFRGEPVLPFTFVAMVELLLILLCMRDWVPKDKNIE